MATKRKTANKPTETGLEHDLRTEEGVLDLRIRDMEMKIAFAESLVTTLTGIRGDMIEVRTRLEQYNKAGGVHDSWMLPPPARRKDR